jgi:DNA repair protein SbcC/Rad50
LHFTTITLENFQGHGKSVFELDKGLNVIVGLSNSGKSSLSRALQFILMGSPWDKSWVKFGSKYCKIILETSTGVIVERHKGDKVNKYILTLPNQEPQTFESFGVGVPEAIQQALNIHEVQINSTETLNLNVALQHDSLFLLSAVPSVRARILGKLSGADILDSSIQAINRDKRQLTAEKQSKELELVDLQAQIDKLAAVEGFSSQISDIETRLSSLSVQEARLQRIQSLFERVSQLKKAWIAETEKESILSQVDLSNIGQLAQRVDKIKKLSLFLSRKVNLEYTEQKIIKQRDLLTPVDISVIPVLAEKTSNLKRVKDLSIRINRNQKELVSKTEELKQVEQKYNEAKEQYSEMLKANGTCPICGVSTI